MIGLDSLINGFRVIRFGQVRRDDVNADIFCWFVGFVSVAINVKERNFKIH